MWHECTYAKLHYVSIFNISTHTTYTCYAYIHIYLHLKSLLKVFYLYTIVYDLQQQLFYLPQTRFFSFVYKQRLPFAFVFLAQKELCSHVTSPLKTFIFLWTISALSETMYIQADNVKELVIILWYSRACRQIVLLRFSVSPTIFGLCCKHRRAFSINIYIHMYMCDLSKRRYFSIGGQIAWFFRWSNWNSSEIYFGHAGSPTSTCAENLRLFINYINNFNKKK